ncbi:MAG: UDP-N-acetylmuramoyl-L-alanyl-D-glutamate--2,6-diaminopimelate ligase [Clostridia bacterium]|nr:UDP-N-acetylmuramoyl-L-alanyl-D-glutamate--2,6-diaminopimelate ligase [Clostridia bacterium]MBQ8717228.1 UDP-N-acetylmuramoyl-L-alanyl-D-glutamate--2,6-diaminopimelate ligase [Clostridia bacterium]
MQLRELLEQAGYAVPAHLRDREITGISSDSRTVKGGNLFVAIQGLSHDGGRFVGQALERGAAFVICERCLEGVEALVVENARAALARLFDAWYGHPAKELSLIGITGTNGKTSTAAMLYAILRQCGFPCGLIGTVECRLNDRILIAPNDDRLANMTTPDPAQLYALLAQMRDGGAKYVLMEVTSHALAFSKVAPLHFARAVFTNLTPDHLDLHGDMESYFAEKRKLFDACDEAVISCSTPYGERLANGLDIPLWRIDGQILQDPVQNGKDGVAFTLSLLGKTPLRIDLPVPGSFSIENGALAAMTALSLGVKPGVIQSALADFSGVKGRMERVGINPFGISVFLDYAHTPDALEKLLRTVRGFCTENERIILMFGCGGDRDRSKRAEMGRIASRLADLVILTSDNCRTESPERILCDILKGIDKEKPFRVLPDRQKAIEFAIGNAKRGDVILLVGKGHEEYEIRGRERLVFCEREIVVSCMAKRAECEADAN